MKTTHLEEKRKALLDRREKLIGRFSAKTRARERTARICKDIQGTNEFLETLDRIEADNRSPGSGPSQYAVSSLFLHECFKKLTADADEQFFFITGPEVGGVLVL